MTNEQELVDPGEVAKQAGLLKVGTGIDPETGLEFTEYARQKNIDDIAKYGQPYCHANCGAKWCSKTPTAFCPGCGDAIFFKAKPATIDQELIPMNETDMLKAELAGQQIRIESLERRLVALEAIAPKSITVDELWAKERQATEKPQ